MKNNYLPILWDYFELQSKIEKFIESKIDDSMLGDDYARYAAFIMDILCHRRDTTISIERTDELIDCYEYPTEFADRLTQELSELLGHNNTD